MQPKNVVTIVLLLFVTVSIIVIAVKSFRRSPKTADAANCDSPELADSGRYGTSPVGKTG